MVIILLLLNSTVVAHIKKRSVSVDLLCHCSATPQVGQWLGPNLDGLSLPGASLTESSLLALLPRLSSLRRLDLSGLDSLFMSGAFLSREEQREQVRCSTELMDVFFLYKLQTLLKRTHTL